MGSCFKGFITRNTMVQSEFNLDTRFSIYDFFIAKQTIMWWHQQFCSFLFVLFAGLHWPTFTSGTVRLCEYRLQSSCYYRENYFSRALPARGTSPNGRTARGPMSSASRRIEPHALISSPPHDTAWRPALLARFPWRRAFIRRRTKCDVMMIYMVVSFLIFLLARWWIPLASS